ncbi:MAG: hypothetical protein ABEI80_02350 [Haloplanus sp.]
MSVPIDASDLSRRTLLFGLLTLVSGGFTAWSIVHDHGPVRLLLLGTMTAYLFGNTLPMVRRRVPHFERIAAVPLGVVGVVAYAVGAPTDLPIFFVIFGVGSLIDLLWDPMNAVYGE